MTPGIVSSRYAKALLKLVLESGNGDAVYGQVDRLLKHQEQPGFVMEPELHAFVELLVKKGRMEYVKFIFQSFLRMYDLSKGRKRVHLVTAVAVPGLEERLKELLEEKTGSRILMESSIDPSIIGGFQLKVEDDFLDASVSRGLEELRRRLVVKNNRLV